MPHESTQTMLDLLYDSLLQSSITESQYEEAINELDQSISALALTLLGVI